VRPWPRPYRTKSQTNGRTRQCNRQRNLQPVQVTPGHNHQETEQESMVDGDDTRNDPGFRRYLARRIRPGRGPDRWQLMDVCHRDQPEQAGKTERCQQLDQEILNRKALATMAALSAEQPVAQQRDIIAPADCLQAMAAMRAFWPEQALLERQSGNAD